MADLAGAKREALRGLTQQLAFYMGYCPHRRKGHVSGGTRDGRTLPRRTRLDRHACSSSTNSRLADARPHARVSSHAGVSSARTEVPACPPKQERELPAPAPCRPTALAANAGREVRSLRQRSAALANERPRPALPVPHAPSNAGDPVEVPKQALRLNRARRSVARHGHPQIGRKPMANLAGKRFESPDEVREFADDKGRVELVDLNGHAVGRGTFEPGWRWSEHVKPIAGTDSCQVEHIGYVLEGRMALRMDDGTEREFGPGDAFHMPPGHDAWIVGDEPCVLLDFGGLKGYAQAS
jgi:quercetin dioxygenase-like cupin family protein